jgi:hypothetical protein
MYEHTIFTSESHQQVLIRIDRFTGEISVPDVYSGGWKTLKPRPPTSYEANSGNTLQTSPTPVEDDLDKFIKQQREASKKKE